jgi:hypothetical protein
LYKNGCCIEIEACYQFREIFFEMVEWKFTAGINPSTISTITRFVKPDINMPKYSTGIL